MISRARRRRRWPSANGGSIEFAELLDAIAAPTVAATAEPVEPAELAEPVERVDEVPEIEALDNVEGVDDVDDIEQVGPGVTGPGQATSRFADAGVDDNRLPLRKTRRRWLWR